MKTLPPATAFCLSLLAAAVLVSAPRATAATISINNPSFSIQTAINGASAGDTILLGPGTYNQQFDLTSKQLFVMSLAGPAVTTINGGNNGTVITMTGNGSRVEGLTITGGRTTFGAGINIGGGSVSSTIRNNIFRNNTQTVGGYGAAIGGNSTSPIIDSNIFRNNDDSGDGQSLASVVGFLNGSSPLITNNLFYDNTARALSFVLPGGTQPTVINNTIVGNETGVRADLFGTAQLTFRNNILSSNGFGLDYRQGQLVFQNNDVFGNATNYNGIATQTGLNGNLSLAPLFLNAAVKDFRVSFLSPAVDAGSQVGAPPRDFIGTPRPQDGDGDGIARVDIGAYELAPEPSGVLCALGLLGVIGGGRQRARRV